MGKFIKALGKQLDHPMPHKDAVQSIGPIVKKRKNIEEHQPTTSLDKSGKLFKGNHDRRPTWFPTPFFIPFSSVNSPGFAPSVVKFSFDLSSLPLSPKANTPDVAEAMDLDGIVPPVTPPTILITPPPSPPTSTHTQIPSNSSSSPPLPSPASPPTLPSPPTTPSTTPQISRKRKHSDDADVQIPQSTKRRMAGKPPGTFTGDLKRKRCDGDEDESDVRAFKKERCSYTKPADVASQDDEEKEEEKENPCRAMVLYQAKQDDVAASASPSTAQNPCRALILYDAPFSPTTDLAIYPPPPDLSTLTDTEKAYHLSLAELTLLSSFPYYAPHPPIPGARFDALTTHCKHRTYHTRWSVEYCASCRRVISTYISQPWVDVAVELDGVWRDMWRDCKSEASSDEKRVRKLWARFRVRAVGLKYFRDGWWSSLAAAAAAAPTAKPAKPSAKKVRIGEVLVVRSCTVDVHTSSRENSDEIFESFEQFGYAPRSSCSYFRSDAHYVPGRHSTPNPLGYWSAGWAAQKTEWDQEDRAEGDSGWHGKFIRGVQRLMGVSGAGLEEVYERARGWLFWGESGMLFGGERRVGMEEILRGQFEESPLGREEGRRAVAEFNGVRNIGV